LAGEYDITPLEAVKAVCGSNYKIKNGQIHARECPYCHGQGQGNEYSFAMATSHDGQFKCLRGSCGATGNLITFCKNFGIDMRWRDQPMPGKKEYTKPSPDKVQPTGDIVREYLHSRGLSDDILELFKVGANGNRIAFPFYKSGELVLIKYRDIAQKAFAAEPGGKGVFLGMDLCSPDIPLIICEGEFDAMSVWEAGIPNAVSLPNGVNSVKTAFENCPGWITQFESVLIWTDSDEAGECARSEIIELLGRARCKIVPSPKGCKDANEALIKYGKAGIIKAVERAEKPPIRGLKRVADISDESPYQDAICNLGISKIDREMLGGFRCGELVVWTGKTASGKSTAIAHVIARALDRQLAVAAYSGELSDIGFRTWLDLQLAGPDHVRFIDEKRDPDDDSPRRSFVPKDTRDKIKNWYADLMYLYDQAIVPVDQIFEVFAEAAADGCKIFVIDNLMTLTSDTGKDSDLYRRQTAIMDRAKAFCLKAGVVVHVVAHPRKQEGWKKNEDIDVDGILGTSNIPNYADTIISLRRISDDEREDIQAKIPELAGKDFTTGMRLIKCRASGREKKQVLLNFDEGSKRFAPVGEAFDYRYGWVEAIGHVPTKDEGQEWLEHGRLL
jgi:twinkle protein